MTAPSDEPRDLAGEHTEREAYRARLRADISVEEANEEAEEREIELQRRELDDPPPMFAHVGAKTTCPYCHKPYRDAPDGQCCHCWGE